MQNVQLKLFPSNRLPDLEGEAQGHLDPVHQLGQDRPPRRPVPEHAVRQRGEGGGRVREDLQGEVRERLGGEGALREQAKEVQARQRGSPQDVQEERAEVQPRVGGAVIALRGPTGV